MTAQARRAPRARVRAIRDPAVAAVFAAYPPKYRRKLMRLRRLILETAAATDGVGAIEETLKWGEPAYLTSETGSGSTVRIGWKAKEPDQYAMYFHCGTDLVARFRELFADEFRFEGNRRIVFAGDDPVPERSLARCIEAALTYHHARRERARRGSARRRRA